MMESNSLHGLAIGWHVHMVFMGVFFVGIVLLIMWAYKNLSKKALLNLVIGLLVVGIVGTLVTGIWGVRGWQSMGNGNYFKGGEMMFDDFDIKEMEEHMEVMEEFMESRAE